MLVIPMPPVIPTEAGGSHSHRARRAFPQLPHIWCQARRRTSRTQHRAPRSV